MKNRLRGMVFILGFGGAVLVLLVAATMDLALSEQVVMIAPHDPSVVHLNRGLSMPGDPVPQLYGNPMSNEVRVVMPDRDHLVRPEEDDSLLLMKVDKLKGENPLQTRTVWFVSRFAIAGFVMAGLLGFALPRRRPGVIER